MHTNMYMSNGKRSIRPACERCHLSKTACNRPEDSACARCIRLGFSADCAFHSKKQYRRSKESKGSNGANASHAATRSAAMQDILTPPQPSQRELQPTTNPRQSELLTSQFLISPAQPPQQPSPSYMETYFQSPSRAPSVVNIPSSPRNHSPYLQDAQPPMYSSNPTHYQATSPLDPRTAMFDRDRDESILLWSEQSATPSTLSHLFRAKPNPQQTQPAFEPLGASAAVAADNPTQPLMQRIHEDRNSEMHYLQHQHFASTVTMQTDVVDSQPSSLQMPAQKMPSHETLKNQPPPVIYSSETQKVLSNCSEQLVPDLAQQRAAQQDQPVAAVQNGLFMFTPFQSVQAPPLPKALPRSVFIQLTELNLRYRLQQLIDRRQLSVRHLHMAAAFISEGMLEQDYIQLSALTPMPLSCSLKADFAQSESYHVWCSRAIEESLGFNKGNKPQKQFVIYFDFSDSPLLCVEDEESAAGMHSVSHLNHMARTPQSATYTMRTSRNICAATRKHCSGRPERSNFEKSTRKRRRSKRSEASTSSSHSSDSDSDDSHESPRSSSRVGTNETSRQELEELIRRRRAAFEGLSPPSSYEEQYSMHLTSCIHYKKNMCTLAPAADVVTSTPFPLDGGQPTPNNTAGVEESCSCPVVVHRRMFAQVNREFERLFGWSQREIRDQLIHFGARRWEQRMWKMNVPAAYEVLLMQFIMSAQLDTNISATLFNKYHSSIPAVIRKHVMVADDGDLDGYTFQFLPISK